VTKRSIRDMLPFYLVNVSHGGLLDALLNTMDALLEAINENTKRLDNLEERLDAIAEGVDRGNVQER
jgi:hypothetical protein